MTEVRGHLDLAEKPLGAELGGQARVQHLEGDRPPVSQVAREIDRGHASTAELSLDRVAVRQPALEPDEGIGQKATATPARALIGAW